MSPFRTLVVFAAVFSFSVMARAADDPPSESIRLTYGAPPNCPSRQAFVDEVNGRGVTLVTSNDPSVRAVSIAVDDVPGWHGHFSITTDAGESSRDVSGSSCEDVVRSLAIFTSLAIGPNAVKPEASAAEAKPALETSRELPPAALPMAPPPTPAPPDLLDGRFQLGVEEGSFVSDGAAAFGAGLRGAYFPTSWLGLHLEGDVYRSFAGQKFTPDGRIAAGLELELFKDQKPLIDLTHSTFDAYLLTQGGMLFSHPTPLGGDYAFKPGLDITVGLGFRYFMNKSFALTVESGLDIFSREAAPENPSLAASRTTQAASTSWVGLTFYFGNPDAR